MSDQPMATPPGANVKNWHPVGAPRRLDVTWGPDLVDFRIAHESHRVKTIDLVLTDPYTDAVYGVHALISDYNVDTTAGILQHVSAELDFETLMTHRNLAPWQHFCFYGFHWPTHRCLGDGQISRHVR